MVDQVSLLIVFSLIALSSAQDVVELTCDFSQTSRGDYICVLTNIEFNDRNVPVKFVGLHMPGRTNLDVDIVVVTRSRMPFIIPEIYTTFPNIHELDLQFAGLVEIDPIPEMKNFRTFIAYSNNIDRIRNNTFDNVMLTLETVDLQLNNIRFLEADAFKGLTRLEFLYLRFNQITFPPIGVFNTLSNLNLIDFESNDFRQIDETLFAGNPRLNAIFADRNGIDRISPRFADNLMQLGSLRLNLNKCVNRVFFLFNEQARETMMRELQPCFDNFGSE